MKKIHSHLSLKIYILLLWAARKFLPGKLRRAAIKKADGLLPHSIPVHIEPVDKIPGVSKKILAPAETIEPRLNFAGAEILPPVFHEKQDFPEFSLLSLERGMVLDRCVISRDGIFVREAILERFFPGNGETGQTARGAKPVYVQGTLTALTNTYMDNYFHWFHDFIAGLLLLPDYRERRYCAPPLRPYQAEGLALLGIGRDRIVTIPPLSFVQCDRLDVFTVPGQGHPALFRSLADRFPDIPEPPRNTYPERIYISREDVPGRRQIANEPELVEALERHGFTKVVFSGMSVSEQFARARAAKFVVMPHGAALLNLSFCRPGTRVLELHSPRFLKFIVVSLAETLGLSYSAVVGKDENTDPQDGNSSFSVDVAAVERLLAD